MNQLTFLLTNHDTLTFLIYENTWNILAFADYTTLALPSCPLKEHLNTADE